MVVNINGDATRVDEGATLGQLVAQQKLPRQGVAIEVSGKIIPRSKWQTCTLSNGDRIEIVQMVGGG